MCTYTRINVINNKPNAFILKNFLLYEEKDCQIENISTTNSNLVNKNNGSVNKTNNYNDAQPKNQFEIVISNATAKWSDDQTNNSLENVNLTMRPGRLVAIVGSVGAGKVCKIQYTVGIPNGHIINGCTNSVPTKIFTEFIITSNFARTAAY